MTDKLPRLWVFSTDNDVATAREMAERIKAEAISERDAELARLRAELEHARNSLARTIDTCNAWSDKYVERNTEAIALRAALAEAERERDEARDNSALWYRSWMAVCKKRNKKNRTIRALVVAARAMDMLGWGAMGKLWNTELRAAVHDIQGIYKQADRQAKE